MTAAGSIIRLFISSTFNDFTIERTLLQQDIFPALRDLCRREGFRFQPIDLRWGVSQEAGRVGRTLTICFEELRRCQEFSPDFNLLILLGDRYGWPPLPESIPAKQVMRLLPYLSPSQSWSFDPDNPDALYRQDSNAVPDPDSPPEYVLLPRDGDRDRWEAEVAEPLRTALARASERAGFTPEESLPFVASATHQEIWRGLFAPGCDPSAVVCALRTFAVPPSGSEAGIYVAAAPKTRQWDASERNDAGRLRALKDDIRARLGDEHILNYSAGWTGDAPELDVKTLRGKLYKLLERRVREVIATRQRTETRDPITVANARFTAERTAHFEGRAEALAEIARELDEPSGHPLMITGRAGIGKSTLLAEAVRQAEVAHPTAVLVTRFIGHTPDTGSLHDLLAGLRHEIAAHYGQEAPAIPAEDAQLIAEFPDTLARATPKQPLILVVDALDQLGAAPQRMDWLPSDLPPHVSIIVSMLPDRPEMATLRERLGSERIKRLGALSREEGARLLGRWLAAVKRTLQPAQREAVMSSFAVEGLPLYLRLAFEQARHWRSFDPVRTLPATIPDLLRGFFAELAHDDQHGPELVAHALASLGAAKHGLAEDELLDVLGRDGQVSEDLHRLSPNYPRIDVRSKLPLPVVLWARLYADLEAYLTEREADGARLITFYHRQLREVVEDLYLRDEDAIAHHQALADYFGAQPRHHGGRLNSRRLSELPYQLAHSIRQHPFGVVAEPAERWLLKTLTDATFLEDKIADQGVSAALDDLALLPAYEQVRTIRTALRAGAVVLRRKPDELVNQVQGRTGHIEYLHAIPTDRPTLRLLFPSLAADPALAAILTGHKDAVNACAFSGDGTRALSASRDQTLRLWDVTSGETLSILRGHPGDVTACVWQRDGRIAVGGYRDGTIQIWDTDSGKILHSLPGHTEQVTACNFSADGGMMLSASRDGTLRLWNTATWQSERILSTPSLAGGQNDCDFSPDGDLALSASESGALQLWDVRTGALIGGFEQRMSDSDPLLFGDAETGALGGFHFRRQPILTCAFHPDGTRALSGSYDGVLRIWDITTGERLAELYGHSDPVTGCAFSPDGRLALSASKDNTLRIWELATGECRVLFKGHADWITSCAFSPDGQRVLSASEDGSLRIWEVAKGRSPYVVFQGQTGPVSACSFGPSAKQVTAEPVRQRQAEVGLPLRMEALPDPLAGSLAASASRDGSLWIWSLADGNSVQFLRRHLQTVIGCAFSPDGQRVVSASADETIREWDLRTGRALRTLKAETPIRSCAFSADGRWALSAAQFTGTLQVWDLASGQIAMALAGQDGPIQSCAISHDGTLIAGVLSWGRTLQVWQRETGEVLHVITCPDGTLRGCAFSPDARRLLCAHITEVTGSPSPGALRISYASTLRLLDIASGRWEDDFGHRAGEVHDLAFSPDGRFALDASRSGTLTLWDVVSGASVTSWLTDVTLTACAYSPDGRHVMAGDTSGGVHFLQLLGVSPQADPPAHSDLAAPDPAPALSPASQRIAPRHRGLWRRWRSNS